jgi:subtilase family serine protease
MGGMGKCNPLHYKDTFTTAIELTGDSDTIKVCADNFNVVGELDEKNNCLENVWPYIPEKKPDLVITDIWTVGNRIHYTIENVGGAEAGRSDSGLYIDGRYSARDKVGPLAPAPAPGATSNEEFERYNYRGGEIEVCADYQDRIAEIDETNNCMEALID